MTNPNTGRFTWHELMAPDAGAAAKFYATLFGWTVQEVDMGPGGTYRLFLQGDKQIGGAMSTPPGVPAHWLTYVGTEDCDASAANITALGGKVLVPPTEVPGMVRFAVAMDPQGAAFGVLKGLGPHAGDAPQDGPPQVGTFCWDELHTTDQAAAGKFYGELFGWTGKVGADPMKYWHWRNAGKDIGGMMTQQMPGAPSAWVAYVAVSDVDASTAKARELGAKILMDPMTIEKVGRCSFVMDPAGAVFALFRPANA